MSVFIKICGMTSRGDAEAASIMGPDAVGFIFWSGSRRYVAPRTVGDWDTADGVSRVGVFVDAEPIEVCDAVEHARLDIVQLHGGEDPSDYAQAGVPLWKVLHLDAALARAESAEGVEAFLVDSRTATMPGGTGRTCDWDAAAKFVRASSRPVLLAGGLNPGNVARALELVRPWGVDVSTGVEQATGEKDLKLVEEFILQCRTRT